jgi:hypothetical protein
MGGYGSGRYGGRPTSESCASLVLQTTTFLRAGLRFGMKGGGTLTYTVDGESFPVSFIIDTMDRDHPYIGFSHTRRTEPSSFENYRVSLLTTPQRFGGVRWWFQCPYTGRRAVRLLLPRGGHQFWSRGAYRLGYASQREDRMGRAQRQATKVYRALGGDGNWMDGPPPKPKWMRWRTYDRMAAKWIPTMLDSIRLGRVEQCGFWRGTDDF